MKRNIITMIVGLLAVFFCFILITSTRSKPEKVTNTNELNGSNILQNVNEFRKTNGVGELRQSDEICLRIGSLWQSIQNYRNSRKQIPENENELLAGMVREFIEENTKNNIYTKTTDINALYGGGENIEATTKQWYESQHLRDVVLKSGFNVGCGFVKEGTTVFLIGTEK